MRKSAALCVLVLGLALAMPAVAADAKNTIRGGIVYSNPTGEGTWAPDPNHTFEADSSFGLGFSYERTITGLMGVNFDLSWFEHDVKISNASQGDTFGEFSASGGLNATMDQFFGSLRTLAANPLARIFGGGGR